MLKSRHPIFGNRYGAGSGHAIESQKEQPTPKSHTAHDALAVGYLVLSRRLKMGGLANQIRADA